MVGLMKLDGALAKSTDFRHKARKGCHNSASGSESCLKKYFGCTKSGHDSRIALLLAESNYFSHLVQVYSNRFHPSGTI